MSTMSRRGLIGRALTATLVLAGQAAFGQVSQAQSLYAQAPSGLSEQIAPRLVPPPSPRQGSAMPAAPFAPGSGVTIKEVPQGTLMSVQGDVLFAFDSAQLRPSSREVLGRVAAYIQERRPPQIAVEGNTDSVGAADYNRTLGQNRARAVVSFLVQAGLPAGIFTIASYGATRPVAANTNPDGSDNPEGRAHNRRVDIILER